MTEIKFDTKVVADVSRALAPFADTMFKQRAGRWVAVIELAHTERTEPGPDEEKDRAVKVRVTSIEVAADEFTDERLRQVQQDLYRRRTAAGTLDEVDTYRANDILRNGVGLHTDAA